MAKMSHEKRFHNIRARYQDVMRTSAEDVRRNVFQRVPMGIWQEMNFLIRMVEELTENDPVQLNKVQADDLYEKAPGELVAA